MKRILALVLTFTLVFCLAACGNDKTTRTSSGITSGETQITTSESIDLSTNETTHTSSGITSGETQMTTSESIDSSTNEITSTTNQSGEESTRIQTDTQSTSTTDYTSKPNTNTPAEDTTPTTTNPTGNNDNSTNTAPNNDSTTKPTIVTVTELHFTIHREDIYVGNSKQIQFTYLPSNANSPTLEWTSTNPNVATVDNRGNVTAHSNGTAIIKAKIPNTIVFDTCTISVTSNSAAACSLVLPNLPKTLSYSSGATLYTRTEVNDINYEFINTFNGKVNLTVRFSGTKLYGKQSLYCKFLWKLKDSNGSVTKTGNFLLGGLAEGDTFTNQEIHIYNIAPDNYKLEIYNVSY